MFRIPESSSSAKRLYIQVWCIVSYMHQYKQSGRQKSVFDTEVYHLLRPQYRTHILPTRLLILKSTISLDLSIEHTLYSLYCLYRSLPSPQNSVSNTHSTHQTAYTEVYHLLRPQYRTHILPTRLLILKSTISLELSIEHTFYQLDCLY